MKTIIANPPWITKDRIGFRSNVRWPFTISLEDYKRGAKCAYHFPLYQAYSAALLFQNGIEVSAIDCSVNEFDNEKFLRHVALSDADLIVVEVSTPSFNTDIKVIEALKKRIRKPVVLIGAHCSVYHRELLEQYDFIDMIARGEYEYSLLEIAQNISHGNNNLDGILGISYRKGPHITVNPERPFIVNLDDLPFPARELWPWERYHEPIYEKLPWITMVSSRGCPYRCTFCCWPQVMYGHKFRTRSPKNVVDEIEYCINKYHPGEIFFDDDTFTIGEARVQAICEDIIHRGIDITWSCMGRIDTAHKDMLRLMHRAGCRRIKFGVETADREIMRRIKKGVDLDRVEEAFRTAKRIGLKVHGTFMIGLPGETEETALSTINLARRLKPDTLQISICTPFPGTEFFKEAENKGWLVTKDWLNYDGNFGSVVSYPQLSRECINYLTEIARQQTGPAREPKPILQSYYDKIKDHAAKYGLGGLLAKVAATSLYRLSETTPLAQTTRKIKTLVDDSLQQIPEGGPHHAWRYAWSRLRHYALKRRGRSMPKRLTINVAQKCNLARPLKASVITFDLLGDDAVGHNIINKINALAEMGFDSRIYVQRGIHKVQDNWRELAFLTTKDKLLSGLMCHDLLDKKSKLQIKHLIESNVIFFEYPNYYDLLELIKRPFSGVKIFDYHGVTPSDFMLTDKEVEFFRVSEKGVSLVSHAHHAIAHSEYTADELSKRYNYALDKISVHPYAVPLDQFYPEARKPQLQKSLGLEKSFVLLFVGRMATNKRIDILIGTIAKLKKDIPCIKLLLAGDDVSEPYLNVVAEAKRMIHQADLSKEVIFVGPVSHGRLRDYYNICDIYVTSSLHEGFCIPVIEAMACGKPVIGTAATALPSTIGDAGLTFPPNDTDKLGEHIKALYDSWSNPDNHRLYAELSKRALQHARQFSTEEYNNRLFSLIKLLVGSNLYP